MLPRANFGLHESKSIIHTHTFHTKRQREERLTRHVLLKEIGHEKAQSVIDSITNSYAAAGESGSNPMLAPQGGPPMGGPGFAPPPFGFPGKCPRFKLTIFILVAFPFLILHSELHQLTPIPNRRHAPTPIRHGRSPWPRRTWLHPSARRPRYAFPAFPSQRW